MARPTMGVTVPPTTTTRRPLTGIRGWLGRPVFLEARSPMEVKALRASPFWQGHGIPNGRQRPALIVPGFLASPSNPNAIAHVLTEAGWQAENANVGRNAGPAYVAIKSVEESLFRIFKDSGQPVTLIGHSRGGQYSRILAVRHPHMVQQVIALGAPLLMKYPRFAPVRLPIELLEIGWRRGAFGPVDAVKEAAVDAERYMPFPDSVDFVSIYSKTDGLVDWRSALDPAATTIEIAASHLGMASSVVGMKAIATALKRQDL